MTELQKIHFKTSADFNKWLRKNHNTNSGIWMIFYKKHTSTPCISYQDALDEALCYGWIDSLVKRVDEETYIRKFTPRNIKSNWSDVNKLKVLKLMNEHRMTIHGLNKIKEYRETGQINWDINHIKPHEKKPLQIPEYINDILKNNALIQHRFEMLTPSQKRNYILWIANAKREDTRHRRIDEMIRLLTENMNMGMK